MLRPISKSQNRRLEKVSRNVSRRKTRCGRQTSARFSNMNDSWNGSRCSAQALGTVRELNAIFRALREFTDVSVPCDGFFVSLYDAVRDVRTACYGWGDGAEVDVSELPPMPVTARWTKQSRRAHGEVIITNDYMRAQRGHPTVVVGPDNGLRPETSMAVPMSVMGRIIGTIEVQSYKSGVYRPEHALPG